MAINTGDIVLADLQEIVGRGYAREAAEGDAIDGVRPRFVVEPGSVEEVSALLRLSHRTGLAVAPRGGGTTLGWGATPRRLDLILSTARLNRVLEHAAGDLVVRAEAGVTLETLQAAVGAAGQRLALNPPEQGATLGGIVAANPSGPLRLRYGTVRDLLIGVTVVLADGTVAKAGGKVVKNVAGYDLCKLFTGSLGTLGVVVETIWRLHPLPAARRTVAVALASPEAAGAAVQDLLHAPGSPLVFDALELRWEWPSPPGPRLTGPSAAADGPARLSLTVGEGETPKLSAGSAPVDPHARLYGGGLGGGISPGSPGGGGGGESKPPQGSEGGERGHLFLSVLFEGIEPGVAAQAAKAARLLGVHGAARIVDAGEQDALWRDARAYPWQGDDVGLKLTHLPTALPTILESIVELACSRDIEPHVAGHAGTGVTFVGLSGGDAGSIGELLGELRAHVARAEGSVVVLQAPLDIKDSIDVWGPIGDALPLMRRVKERFDPEGILNPGRFVGGI
jgi:glycolate oxidase FAD binding subunit